MQVNQATSQSFKPVCHFVLDTYSRIETMDNADQELCAVMKEFAEKARELAENIEKGSKDDIMETIIEVEQAADSALKVAKLSDSYGPQIVDQIKQAHNRVRDYKQQHLN